MGYNTPDTQTQRWKVFQGEGAVRTSPPNKLTDEQVEEIKRLLASINPDTGFIYGIKEIARKTGIGRVTISKILLKMRRGN